MIRYVDDYVPEQRAVLNQLPLLHKTKTRSYLDLLGRGALKLRPGIERLVYEAQDRGLKLAIATTSTPTNVKALLRSTLGEDSPNWFAISAGDVVSRKKPSPDVYFEALEALDVGPGHAVAFEDSTNGLRAAQEAESPSSRRRASISPTRISRARVPWSATWASPIGPSNISRARVLRRIMSMSTDCRRFLGRATENPDPTKPAPLSKSQ